MLDADLKTQLAAYLEKLQQPIELVASLDDSDAARELDALLADIAALSPMISRAAGNDPRTPSFLIRRTGSDVQVGFAAIRCARCPATTPSKPTCRCIARAARTPSRRSMR